MASGLADVPSFSPDVCVFINTLVSQISLVPSPLAPPMSSRPGALVVRYRREIKRVECTEEMAPPPLTWGFRDLLVTSALQRQL